MGGKKEGGEGREENLAAAAGANDDAAVFTTDEDKAFATLNAPASDSMSVSVLDAGATFGRMTDNGDETVTHGPNGQFKHLIYGETDTAALN
ncbi:MAG: hypothetical protein GY859_35210 [Desulfobacterales bacterium]|nr:hypothetical protein [Desulfobacterales bacterium]